MGATTRVKRGFVSVTCSFIGCGGGTSINSTTLNTIKKSKSRLIFKLNDFRLKKFECQDKEYSNKY